MLQIKFLTLEKLFAESAEIESLERVTKRTQSPFTRYLQFMDPRGLEIALLFNPALNMRIGSALDLAPLSIYRGSSICWIVSPFLVYLRKSFRARYTRHIRACRKFLDGRTLD